MKPLIFPLLLVVILTSSNTLHSQVVNKMEALLIVGPQEDGTKEAMEKMNKIGQLFQEKGIVVHTFYDTEAKWEAIKDIASQCSFLVYAGHGSTMGSEGNVGGLCIASIISTETLMAELKLKSNALIVFQSVCYGAGSSATDNEDIGLKEAKKRVLNYAYPFFKIGASAYYANNYVDGCYEFLKDFLSGMSLKKAYKKSTEIWTDIEFEAPFEKSTSKLFSIASSNVGGFTIRTVYMNGSKTVTKIPTIKGYKVAYVGAPEFNIIKMTDSQ